MKFEDYCSEERAAILEFDANMSRDEAEKRVAEMRTPQPEPGCRLVDPGKAGKFS
jgi:hypothetical protein